MQRAGKQARARHVRRGMHEGCGAALCALTAGRGPGFRTQSRIRPLWVRPVEGSPNASSAGFASYGADRWGGGSWAFLCRSDCAARRSRAATRVYAGHRASTVRRRETRPCGGFAIGSSFPYPCPCTVCGRRGLGLCPIAGASHLDLRLRPQWDRPSPPIGVSCARRAVVSPAVSPVPWCRQSPGSRGCVQRSS